MGILRGAAGGSFPGILVHFVRVFNEWRRVSSSKGKGAEERIGRADRLQLYLDEDFSGLIFNNNNNGIFRTGQKKKKAEQK